MTAEIITKSEPNQNNFRLITDYDAVSQKKVLLCVFIFTCLILQDTATVEKHVQMLVLFLV